MPVSRSVEVGGREVTAKVSFELDEHAAQMKVTMVEGNSTASVVAYCCAALNDRLRLNLISSKYTLRVTTPLPADHPPSGYLYGLCDVLTHPDVAATMSDLTFSLTPLPHDHPEGMYVAPSTTTMRSPTSIRPPIPISPAGYDEVSRLEQAFTEEAEREMIKMGFSTRRGLFPEVGQRPADEMASERILQARENMRKASIPPPPPNPRQFASTDTQTVEIVEVPQMQPKAAQSAPSQAVEMLKVELKAAEENVRGVKEKLQAAVERVEVAETGLREQQTAAIRYAELLEIEKGKSRRKAEVERECEGLRDDVARLEKDNARLQRLQVGWQDRERQLLSEISSLQNELAAEADTTLMAPLLPQPISITNITTSIPRRTSKSGSPVRERYQRVTRDVELVRSPGSPEVKVNPGDSLGEIVAKFTGKTELGRAVDSSLKMPVLEEEEDESSEEEDNHQTGLLSQVSELRRKLPLLSDPTSDPTLRHSLLKEVEAIRNMATTQRPHPTPGFGPGSPGGPRSRSSSSAYPQIMYNPPQAPPPPSSVASGYSATRPPGL